MAADTPRPGIMGAVEAQLEAMSPRDRTLLTGLVAFFGLIAVVLLLITVRGAVNDMASRVSDAKDDLDLVSGMADQYSDASKQVQAGEARLAQYKDQPVSAYLESAAQKTGLQENLTAVNEQGSEVVGGLRQTHYKVEIKRATLEALTRFLYEIESSGYPLHVDTAHFKSTMVAGEKQIDLTIELVGFAVEAPK